MKKILVFLMIICAGAAYAEKMTLDEWQEFNAELRQSMDDYKEKFEAGEVPPIKCATPLALNLNDKRPAKLASDVMAVGDRYDTLTYTYGTTHFLLHYTDNGPDSIYQFDIQDSLTGTPDYIFMAGKICEEVYDHFVYDLGYDPPLSDGYYSGGGDGRYDLYFANLSYYGGTWVDSSVTDSTATSYIYMENDYEGFQAYVNDRLAPLSVTIAHELFHAIQFGYDVTEIEFTDIVGDYNPSWIEMSATYMEEEHYDDVNDYSKYYLPYFYNYPHYSLRFGTTKTSGNLAIRGYHMYGSVVWPIFLSQKFDAQIITNIWDSCRTISGPNWLTATDNVIRTRSGGTENFVSMFREFNIWNVFTDTRARPGEFFEEASSYDMVYYADIVTSYPTTVIVDDTLRSPDNLGANYISLNNLSSMTDGLRIVFSPDPSSPWTLQVVGLPADVANDPIYIDTAHYDENTNSISIPNASSFNKIVLIPAVLSGADSTVSYSLTITTLGEGVSNPNGGESLLVGSVYNISWYYNPTTVSTVDIDLSIDGGQTWNDIAQVANTPSTYSWLVPSSPSNLCLIRVSDADNPSAFDISNAVFTIGAAGASKLYDPYPNPAWIQSHDSVTFKATVATQDGAKDMNVSIVNISGERIRDNIPTLSGIGDLTIGWDFTNNNGELVSAGAYIAIIQLGGETFTKKIMVLH